MQEMIVLARIGSPCGVQGWFRVHAHGDDPQGWSRMPQWWLAARANSAAPDWQAFDLKGMRSHGKGYIAALAGIEDRNSAEKIRGWYISAPREALPPTAEGEYYWSDLTGLVVKNLQDETLGRVTGLISTGVHDVLRVQADDQPERLIPFVSAYVPHVDLAGGEVRVDWHKDW